MDEDEDEDGGHELTRAGYTYQEGSSDSHGVDHTLCVLGGMCYCLAWYVFGSEVMGKADWVSDEVQRVSLTPYRPLHPRDR